MAIYITGVKFSSAFYAIRRSEFLKIAELLEEDEQRMVRFLLNDTYIKPRRNKRNPIPGKYRNGDW